MSFLFGNLCAIKRGKELFYCFLEAKEKLFSSVNDNSLRTAIQFLGINFLTCTEEEFFFFQQHLPLEFAPFLLLSEQNLLRMYRVIVDLSETANFDFRFPRVSSYQAKSKLVLGDSHSAVKSTTVSSEACLFQGRLREWVRECSESNNKFNDRGVLRNKLCSTEAEHIKSNDVLHLANDSSVGDNDCIIEDVVSNSKIDSLTNRSYDKLVSPVEGETSSSGYQFPFAASCQALSSNDTDISVNQADSDENKGTGYGKSSSNVATNVSNPSNPVVPSSDTSSVSVDNGIEKKKKTSLTLGESEMSPSLRSELSKVRQFYSLQINCDREGNALQKVTIDKMVERVSALLWFSKNVKGIEPSLIHCGDAQLVQEFVHYMMDKRGTKPITCSRYITAFLNVSKVRQDSHERKEDDLSESLEKVRAVQRQLERLSRKERVDDLARKPQDDKVVYSELLELCRELKWEVFEMNGTSQARSCMNLCLLLLYCSANPGRAKEYITLRIYQNQCSEESKDQNFICFNEDGTVILLEDSYKTRSTYGPNRTDLTPLTFLTYYLKLYYSKMRPRLLSGKEHDYFFVNPRGDAFSQSSYSNYISALFEKHFSRKLTTADLRKAVVTHFLSLPQSSDYSLRESFASLMKHSVRTQKRYYDERPLAQKKSRALEMLGSFASRSLDEDSVEIVSDEDDKGNIEYLPGQGEFVALVAANSTETSPEVFVAKVLRLSEDRKTAYLAEFEETEPGKYKLNAGKSYKEAVNALIYPVDIVYLHTNGVYELRTPKIDVHHQVHKK